MAMVDVPKVTPQACHVCSRRGAFMLQHNNCSHWYCCNKCVGVYCGVRHCAEKLGIPTSTTPAAAGVDKPFIDNLGGSGNVNSALKIVKELLKKVIENPDGSESETTWRGAAFDELKPFLELTQAQDPVERINEIMMSTLRLVRRLQAVEAAAGNEAKRLAYRNCGDYIYVVLIQNNVNVPADLSPGPEDQARKRRAAEVPPPAVAGPVAAPAPALPPGGYQQPQIAPPGAGALVPYGAPPIAPITPVAALPSLAPALEKFYAGYGKQHLPVKQGVQHTFAILEPLKKALIGIARVLSLDASTNDGLAPVGKLMRELIKTNWDLSPLTIVDIQGIAPEVMNAALAQPGHYIVQIGTYYIFVASLILWAFLNAIPREMAVKLNELMGYSRQLYDDTASNNIMLATNVKLQKNAAKKAAAQYDQWDWLGHIQQFVQADRGGVRLFISNVPGLEAAVAREIASPAARWFQ